MESRDQTRKQLEAQITGKAISDLEFRNQLLKNPKDVVEIETGIRLPADLNITVLEEHANEVYLVLPVKEIPETAEELTEADLSRVEGGGLNRIMSDGWTCAESGWF
jgi:hypothetical protein